MNPVKIINDLEDLEIELLLEAVYRHYGYDFRDYAYAWLKRRIKKRMKDEKLGSVSALQDKLLHDSGCLERLLNDLSIQVTSLFRDPGFYLALRTKVVPLLRTYPFIRIWIAGCATGEEVYSLAIILSEEGMYEKCRIYATDFNEAVLKKAEAGIYPMGSMKEYTRNYQQAGGKKTLSEYYTAAHDNVILRPALKKNVIFSQHNLVTDSSFNEFNLIMCRNVMIYFNKKLQERVHTLFYTSLPMFGVLGLGSEESIKFTPYEDCYEQMDANEKIYRKVK